MVGETLPESEGILTTKELRRAFVGFLQREYLVDEPSNIDFLFKDEETGEPRGFDDALGATVGWLYEQGYDGHKVLAEAGILETDE